MDFSTPPRGPQDAVSRFLSLVPLRIRYSLHGSSTWNPRALPAPGTAGNCSVALCWAIGLPIKTSIKVETLSGVAWLNSDGIISLIRRGLFGFSRVDRPEFGDIGAFGWNGGTAGHVWMVSGVDPVDGRVSEVIDCSPRNGRLDSVRRHAPTSSMLAKGVTYGRFRP